MLAYNTNNNNNNNCIVFSTLPNGIITKASLTFNSTVYENQLNKVLCFLIKDSFARINQIININGRSCSLQNSAINYYYQYNGNTISN